MIYRGQTVWERTPTPSPVITNINNSISSAYGTTSGVITATTDINSICKWSRNADFTYSSQGTAFSSTGGTSHSTTVTGLTGGANVIYVRCVNAADATKVSAVSMTSANIAIAPPSAPTGANMQLIGTGKDYSCPTTRTRVRDARDGATYWIRKISNTKTLGGPGDLCWMETNLAYAGGGTNTYGDVIPAITQGSTSADGTYVDERYFIPTGSNRTTGTTNPSTSANGTGQYGYLYNWCAAMGGQSSACQGTSSLQPNQNKNPGNGTIYNICPAGWRLPASHSSGEFYRLNAAINGSSTTSPSGLLTNSLYMYSSFWYSGSFFTSYGEYWGSTASSNTTALHLEITSSSVSPSHSNSKQGGFAVRCITN